MSTMTQHHTTCTDLGDARSAVAAALLAYGAAVTGLPADAPREERDRHVDAARRACSAARAAVDAYAALLGADPVIVAGTKGTGEAMADGFEAAYP